MGKRKRGLLSLQPSSAKKQRRPLVIPTSDRVYTKSTPEGRRDFYDGVQLDVPHRHYDDDFHVPATKWTVHVGDLVAIHCDESLPPERKAYSRKSVWYPFTKPWSPGQIICLFQDFKHKGKKGGDDVQMQIRWLYRKQDLIEENAEKFEKQLADLDHKHPWKYVYETDAVDEFVVTAALGKIVLSSLEHSSLQGSFQDEATSIPQMTHVCQDRVGEGDQMKKKWDWDHYNDWKPHYQLPDPLLRGLDCLESHSHSDKALRKALVTSIYERWRDDHEKKPRSNALLEAVNAEATHKTKSVMNAEAVPKTASQDGGKAAASSVNLDDMDKKMPAVKKSDRKSAGGGEDMAVPVPVSGASKKLAERKGASLLETDKSSSAIARGSASRNDKVAAADTVNLKSPPNEKNSVTAENKTSHLLRSSGGRGLRRSASRQCKTKLDEQQQAIAAKLTPTAGTNAGTAIADKVAKASAKASAPVTKRESRPRAARELSNSTKQNVTKSAPTKTSPRSATKRPAPRPVMDIGKRIAAARIANIATPPSGRRARHYTQEDLNYIRRATLNMSPTVDFEVSEPSSEEEKETSAPAAVETDNGGISTGWRLEDITQPSIQTEDAAATSAPPVAPEVSAPKEEQTEPIDVETAIGLVKNAPPAAQRETRASLRKKEPKKREPIPAPSTEESRKRKHSSRHNVGTGKPTVNFSVLKEASGTPAESSIADKAVDSNKKEKNGRGQEPLKPVASKSDEELRSSASDSAGPKGKNETALMVAGEASWICRKCDRENEAGRKRCSPPCRAWRGGKRVQKGRTGEFEKVTKESPSEGSDFVVEDGNVIHSIKTKTKCREYFSSVRVRVREDAFAPRILSKKSGGKQPWTLRIGDFVCVECEESYAQADHILERNKHRNSEEARQWYPFLVPWSLCQIISIHREEVCRNGKKDVGEVMLAIRWYYRKSDLLESTQALLPFELDGEVEEVFETDHIQMNYDVGNVLSPAELLLGNANECFNPRKEGERIMEFSSVRCRCRYFVPSLQNEVAVIPQPLFHTNTNPQACLRSSMDRCLHLLDIMSSDTRLKSATAAAVLDTISGRSSPSQDSSLAPYHSSQQATPLSGINAKGREYFKSIPLPPPWDNFQFGGLIWPPGERRADRSWTLTIGDIVALHVSGSGNPSYPQNKESKWYPYNVPWSLCQVLAIFRNASEQTGERVLSTASNDFMVEIRWLYRESDLPNGVTINGRLLRQSKELQMEIIFGTDHVEKDPKEVASLLGPVNLVGLSNTKDGITGFFSPYPPFMPIVMQLYGGEYFINKKDVTVRDKFSTQTILERGIQLSQFTNKQKKQVLGLLRKEEGGVTGAPKEDDTPHATNHCDGAPSKDKERTHLAESKPNSRQTRQSKKTSIETTRLAATKSSVQDATDDYERTLRDFTSEAGGEASSEIVATVKQAKNDEPTQPTPSTSEKKRVGVKGPYHVDISSMTSYYKEVYIVPPFNNYVKGSVAGEENQDRDTNESSQKFWTVKMGDVVIVNWGKEKKEGEKEESTAAVIDPHLYYPYLVRWSAAEVVTIFRTHSSKDEMPTLGSVPESIHLPNDQDSIKVEVRWLYRKSELPGSAPCMSTMNQDKNQSEEVLETDAVNDVTASSLLAPANLYDEQQAAEYSECFLRMPIKNFHCRRFWSIYRKSLLPCGSVSGMKERSRLHSQYLGRNQVLRAAIESSETDASCSSDVAGSTEVVQPTVSQSNAFRRVIMKLSLIDASEATNVHGMKLTGREREQNRLISFLRSAIRCEGGTSDNDSDRRKSSMFVAGPPGTGKTASVRCAIEMLRHEQTNGDVPEFEFVYLNGMEMRHPFEAYVKLWEALSGTKKEKLSPGAAAAELEKHFTQSSRHQGSKRRVTVLLLDELDYLVTRKQTVLYNFFDWPIRTAKTGTGPRLVVVGISNTLNLPERLKPSVQSRLGGERCDFRSYKVDEMVKILKIKIDGEHSSDPPVFDEDAILFAARQTASRSGDVRKALQICKSAAEVVLAELEDGNRDGPPVVRVRDVQRISREANSSVLSKAVSMSTPFEALLLVSLASLTRTSGRGNGGFDMKEVMTKLESVAAGSGDLQYMPPPNFGETLEMLNRLGEARLVTLHTPKNSGTTFRAAQGGSGGAWPLVSLNMEDASILTALRDTVHSELAGKYLRRSGQW